MFKKITQTELFGNHIIFQGKNMFQLPYAVFVLHVQLLK